MLGLKKSSKSPSVEPLTFWARFAVTLLHWNLKKTPLRTQTLYNFTSLVLSVRWGRVLLLFLTLATGIWFMVCSKILH